MPRIIHRTAFKHLRVVGPLAVVAALGIGSLPALAQSAPTTAGAECSGIHFELANPGAGGRVEQGNTVVQGVATDKRATTGMGIDRVDFFLESRDMGGRSIGSSTVGTQPGPFGPGSFQTTLSFPNTNGDHDLFAYAHSSVTGQESVIDFPIGIGDGLSKQAATAAGTGSDTCSPGGNPGSPAAAAPPTTTTPLATTPATTTGATVAMTPSASTITLVVSNPSPGDTIHVGGVNIQGQAWDRTAQSGAGIDRVDVFLDNRDDGGIMLTRATLGAMNTWQAHVALPSNQTGLHTLNFYAHSSVSDRESLVTVPVTIDP